MALESHTRAKHARMPFTVNARDDMPMIDSLPPRSKTRRRTRLLLSRCQAEHSKRLFRRPPFESDDDDSALQTDGDRVGSIVGAELGQDVLDMPLHRIL